jgi:DNA invertase Pin-like site-specific DNA recombinase
MLKNLPDHVTKKSIHTTSTGRKIIQITSVASLPPLKRVAIYCRPDERRSYSLEIEMDYFRKCVQKTPNWLLVGEYVERSSTAETEQREQLSRLLEGCHAGQINFVITQSVKWFGYNTTETLDILRELQTLGVDVYFENEELHSLGPDGKLRTNALMAYMF